MADRTAETIARIGPARLAQAITAPSSLLAAGAVGGIAIAAAGPIGLVAGGVAWLAFTALRLRPKEILRGQTAPQAIDPFAIGDPWRRAVLAAQSSESRFERALEATVRGPVREHLSEIRSRVHAAVAECWTIAVRGDHLDDAIRDLDVRAKKRDYELAEGELAANRAPARQDALTARRNALRSQLEAAQRLVDLSGHTEDQLSKLNAQLDELVARGIELSVTRDISGVDDLGAGVDAVVAEMEGLRRAMEETEAISRTGRADAIALPSAGF